MSLPLREAIVRRWNAAGLDSSVAPLYAGDRDAAPETTALPRAQYVLPIDALRAVSRGSREIVQPVRFVVAASTDRQSAEQLEAIESSFVNSEAAGTDPFAIDSADGTIRGVGYVGKSISQENANVFRGSLLIDVQWIQSNTPPN